MSSTPLGLGTFCWFENATTNRDGAKSFYADVFRWSPHDVPVPGEAATGYTIFRIGDADVAGCYEMQGPQFEGVPPHWACYVKVESADAAAARAAELGGQVLVPPFDVPGVGRMAFLKDPTGAAVAIFQAGEHTGRRDPGRVHGAMGWCELTTPDPAAAGAFYSALFGWEVRPSGDGYTELHLDGRSIGGMPDPKRVPPGAPPNWLPYVAVDDCDAVAQRVQELDGKLLVPPTSIPDVGRFSVALDPAGACIAFSHLEC